MTYNYNYTKEKQYFSIWYGPSSNRVDFGRLCDAIIKIERNVPNLENSFSVDRARYGSVWRGSHIGKRTIKVTYQIFGGPDRDAEFRREIIRAVTNYDGPQRLEFNDEPNLYYMAILDGEQEHDYDINEQKAEGTLTFVVPDGLAHSKTIKRLTKESASVLECGYQEDQQMGRVTLTVNNKGTEDAYPNITIKNNAQTGVIGIVTSNYGRMQIGEPYDLSETNAIEEGRNSETLIDLDSTNTEAEWMKYIRWDTDNFFRNVRGVSPYSNNVGSGSYRKGGYTYTRKQNDGTWGGGWRWNNVVEIQEGKSWTAHPMIIDLPADSTGDSSGSQNWIVDLNLKVWQEKMGMTGFICVSMCDSSYDSIASYDIAKGDTKGDNATAKFRDVNKIYLENGDLLFGPNNNESGQKKPNIQFNSKSGNVRIVKEGAKITWYYNGKGYSYNIASAEHKKCTSIVVYSGCCNDKNDNRGMSQQIFAGIKFTKVFTDTTSRQPNKFSAGSQILIDNEAGRVKSNMSPNVSSTFINDMKDVAIGSTYFALPPGLSTIELYVSRWTTSLPDVEVEWSENYL